MDMRFTHRVKPPAVAAAICALVWGSCLVLRAGGMLEYLELKVFDLWCRWQPADGRAASEVVIVLVNEQDISRLGHYPISDQELADLLLLLLEHEPTAIGLDIIRDVEVVPGRAQLRRVLLEHDNIVACMLLGDRGFAVGPPPELADQPDRIGFADYALDRDGTVRRAALSFDNQANYYFSLALQLATIHLAGQDIYADPDENDPGLLKLGPTTFTRLRADDGGYVGADDRGYQHLLDYRARLQFQRVTYSEIVDGRIEADHLRGKIVLVGIGAESVKDHLQSPFGAANGVAIHATAVDQLLRAGQYGARPLAVWPGWAECFWMLGWTAAAGLVHFWSRSAWRFTLAALGGLGAMMLIVYVAFGWGYWLPALPPALSWLATGALLTAWLTRWEAQQRDVLMGLFSKHVASDVAATIWAQRHRFLNGGRLQPMTLMATVLFLDLKGFATLAEKLGAMELMTWLNQYMQGMAGLVSAHGGLVNKFGGDALMATFGLPLPRTSRSEIARDATNAVRCAVAMRIALAALNHRWARTGQPRTQMRIGIFTGPVITGSLGSDDRLEYAVVGDTVNTASRLESYDKQLMDADICADGCRILVGQATIDLIDGDLAARFVGRMPLRGKANYIDVWGVAAQPTDQPDPIEETVS